MAFFIGLDLGSRRTKAVIIENSAIVERECFKSWPFDRKLIEDWVHSHKYLKIGATGYGRYWAKEKLNALIVTEIKAFAAGAKLLAPSVKTLIDIGGQDAKAIRLGENSIALDFEMNDRCAAGTGKFLELAAKTLSVELSELSPIAAQASEAAALSNTCAVFAESEIIGLLAQGVDTPSLARGVFKSVAGRIFPMLQRIRYEEPLILVGGGASPSLAHEISELVCAPISLANDGIFFGALGVAHLASQFASPPEIGLE